MSLSIGPATDYLVAIAKTAVTGLTVHQEPVLVVDGYPIELTNAMFVIGLHEPPPDGTADISGTRARISPEVGFAADTYIIPCFIDVRVGGTSQKAARDGAASIFNVFWTLFIADLTLGGALRNGTADITEIVATPSNVGTVGEPGRRQFIGFGVTCIGTS